jgi:hypothetical protein
VFVIASLKSLSIWADFDSTIRRLESSLPKAPKPTLPKRKLPEFSVSESSCGLSFDPAEDRA